MRISDAIAELIDENALLRFGFHQRLFNLSRLAAFLLPAVTARTRKEVQPSAVVMALSRLQRGRGGAGPAPPLPRWHIDNISVNSNLCALTYAASPELRQQARSVINKMQREGRFVTVTHGLHELTIIGERDKLQALRTELPQRPAQIYDRIGSIGISLAKNYSDTPGLFYSIFQQLYLQSITIVEIASTAGELVLYLREDDIRLAFDTLYHQFALREPGKRGRSA